MKLTTIYEGSLFECQIIKNMLENEGIKVILKDEIIGSRAHAWVPTNSVKVEIMEQDFENARPIVEQFEKNRQTD